MTSKVLTKAVIHNGRQNIKQSAKIMVIITALHLFAFPALLINTASNYITGRTAGFDEIMLVIAIGTTFIAGLAGIIIALMNYRYLYNKSQVDMCLSQPMTRKQRFLSDYFSGLISYIAPFIAVDIISALLLLIFRLTMEGKEFAFSNADGSVYYVTCDYFAVMASYFYKLVIIGILMMIMLYTITVLIAVCCGSLFETVLYTIFANAAIPAFFLILQMGYFNDIFGADLDYIWYPVLSLTSPAGGLFEIAFSLVEQGRYIGYYQGLSLPAWAIGYLIITAAMLLGAYFLYMKRKAEQVGKPFVFKGLYYVVITFITFCIAAVFMSEYGRRLDMNKLVPLIMTTFVVYMILEIVSRRGFKRIWAGIIRYAATLFIFVGFGFICDATYFFGIETRVPAASSVAKVHICYNGVFSEENVLSGRFNWYSGKKYQKDAVMSYEITSPESIEAIVYAHSAIVEDHISEKTGNQDAGRGAVFRSFSICYFLKNGQRVVRNYSEMPVSAAEALSVIDSSEEYRRQYASYAKAMCDNAYDGQLSHWINPRSNAEKDKHPKIYITPLRIYDYDHTKSYESQFMADREFFARLGEAMESDILNIPAEKIFRPSSASAFRIEVLSERGGGARKMYAAITKDYPETMSLLYEYGFAKCYDYENFEEALEPQFKGVEIKIYTPEETKERYGTDVIYTEAKRGYYSPQSGRSIVSAAASSEELAELFKGMHGMYITKEPCYTISVNGSDYVVPPELTALAEKIYASSVMPDENGSTVTYNGDILNRINAAAVRDQ